MNVFRFFLMDQESSMDDMMEKKKLVWLSKKLAYILRHGARKKYLDMDVSGWIDLDQVLKVVNDGARELISIDDIEHVVENNDKKRFSIKDGKIRANQGHSMDIDLGLTPIKPPKILFHGTGSKSIPAITREGLKKMKRHHVHLSMDKETARKVGGRHGKPAILEILAEKMHDDGLKFYFSENGVWLVDHVPPTYLKQVWRESNKK